MSKTLLEILEEDGLKLRKSGVRFITTCPYHGGGERTPPFTIYPNDTYYCWSAGCQAWGDAVKYLVDIRKMSPDEAMDYVGQDYRTPRRRTTIKITNTAKAWPFLYSVAEIYHQNLLQTQGALSYLRNRGLSMETIEKYKLGYTDGGILNLQWAEEVSMAVNFGLINDTGYEMMSHRITIPNIPEPGMCDAMTGRTVTNDRVRYLNIRTPKVVYGLAEAWPSSVLFVTEGHFDWLVLREWGYPSVVVGGTHIKDIDINILRQKNIVIVPDNDAEGIKAGVRLKSKLGVNSMILDYASLDVKDVGEAAQKEGAREEFDQLVKEQVIWPLYSSSQTLVQLFPILKEKIPLASTLKQPAYLL